MRCARSWSGVSKPGSPSCVQLLLVVLCLSGVCVRFVYPNTLRSCLHSSKQRMQSAHYPDSATQNRSTNEGMVGIGLFDEGIIHLSRK